MENHDIIEKLNNLQSQIKSLGQIPCSTETNELFAALAKAQSKMKVAEKTSKNPFFKSNYADFTEVVAASRQALTENGLCVTQIIDDVDGVQYLTTILGHSSGQWVNSRMRITPAKQDVQSLGSYITYIKRYAYAALVGVCSGDEDDDGEKAVVREPQKVSKKIDQDDDEFISADQYKMLKHELNGYLDIEKKLLMSKNLNGIEELQKKDFMSVMERIRKIKSDINEASTSIQ